MKGYFKYILSGLIISISFMSALSQNYIGMGPVEIAAAMKAGNPQFKLDKTAVNNTYKYLKYVDKISEQTILFFMTEKNVCTYVRWMADYSNLNDIIPMLNKKYRKTGENTWSYADKGENYSVKMEEEEWYFTITFRKN
jgi:hypothetical protein